MSTITRPHLSEVPRPPHDGRSGTQRSPQPTRPARRRKRRWPWLLLAAVAVAVAIGVLVRRTGDSLQTDGALVLYDVKPTDLEVSVTERGNLESQLDVQVLCEVDDVSGDGINGTPIVWIVENGSSVKKDDLLVELDSTPLRDRLDEQQLAVQTARAAYIQAKVQYENQVTQNATNLAEAKLAVELAGLAVKQFQDEEGGTFQIELQDLELLLQEAEAGQLIEKKNLEGVEQLYKLGYRSSGELAQARLNALRSERLLATALSKRRELVEYKYKKQKMELEGKLASAQRTSEQVENGTTKRCWRKLRRRWMLRPQRSAREKNCWPVTRIRSANARSRRLRTGWLPMQPVTVGTARRFVPDARPSATDHPVPAQSAADAGENLDPRIGARPHQERSQNLHPRGRVSRSTVPRNRTVRGRPAGPGRLVRLRHQGLQHDCHHRSGSPATQTGHDRRRRNSRRSPAKRVGDSGAGHRAGRPGNLGVCSIAKVIRTRQGVRLGATNDKFVEICEGLSEGDRVVLNPSAIADSSRATKKEPASAEEDPASAESQPAEAAPAAAATDPVS